MPEGMREIGGFAFDNSYTRLGEQFYRPLAPTPVKAPALVRVNEALAREIGIDPTLLTSAAGIAMLAGNTMPPGAASVALAYAGHQFGHFTPQLGDGRAILLGEVIGQDGLRRDIQLKGTGRTPFSRGGDGRAALGPVLREYLISEAMAALGIPTTRALAAVTTGEEIWRETPMPGAVLARVAASHIRVGTFQYFAARGDMDAVRTLADYTIARHYPDAATAENPYRALLANVVARQADLMARWLLVGFIHGVMNTDNTAISGETIDYGPCAFMDAYNPAQVFSSIDRQSRYAYRNQAQIAHWNLCRFAETLLPLLATEEDAAVTAAQEILAGFSSIFTDSYFGGLGRKIGIASATEEDRPLIQHLLKIMAENQADFTLTFRNLADSSTRDLFIDPTAYDNWAERWQQRLATEPESRATMRAANPAFIPRNHLVEAALSAAVERADFAPFEELLLVLSTPFDDQPQFARYAQPPTDQNPNYQTFCGT